MAEGKRNLFIDAVKGIGIISIVIGHASWDINVGTHVIHIGAFVYLYHLAIFAFCSGYLFKEDNFDIWSYVGKKVRGLYKPFFIYSILYLATRWIWVKIGIVSGTQYTITDYVINLSNILTFNSMGELLGAFWFVPMLFFSSILYAAIQKTTVKVANETIREGLRVCMYIVCGIVGVFAMKYNLGLLCNLQVSYLFVPIMAAGAYFKKFSGEKILTLPGLALSFGIMCYVVYSDLGIIELSRFMIINEWLFYPVTFVGIYFVLTLASILVKGNIFKNGLAKIGQYSFDIMALHFFAFKIVDYIVCHLINRLDSLGGFPRAFDTLWPVYYIVGIILPIFIKRVFERFSDKVLV